MITVKFGSLKFYTALTSIKPSMKDLSSISHQAPFGANPRSVEILKALIEVVPQMDLSGLANALKTTKTWGWPVVKDSNKILIQGGTSVL